MTHTATVASIRQITPDVKQFRLVVPDHEFDFEPGQHTQIHVRNDGEEVVRPYTATNLPGTNQLTLAIKRYPDGTASTYMHERERGDEIEIEELDGNLSLRDADADVAFVSTGTGITPMMAMLKRYVEEGTGEAHFFFGEKDREHLIYRETLDQFEAGHEDVHVHFSLSREDWDGLTGHVQEHLPDALETLDDTHFYVCGVPEMVVETKELLSDEGVPDDRVFSEGWEDDEVVEES
ncbi:ferredoxin--NADP reductase [Halegenticoccus soli]|uniref:ferredoxin--NADP reductase n=1 Tax=Halegenticoccus soli TaxID=1985678 RepID=UPI000C6E8131|nr:FAD-dependent oxidoreductase [Halegenticoccus soli]